MIRVARWWLGCFLVAVGLGALGSVVAEMVEAAAYRRSVEATLARAVSGPDAILTDDAPVALETGAAVGSLSIVRVGFSLFFGGSQITAPRIHRSRATPLTPLIGS